MFVETGVSARLRFRKMFESREDAIKDVNKYKEYSNVYHSIYWYRDKEEKFNRDGTFKRMGPDYNTAIINRIVFDLDSWKKQNNEPQYYVDDGIFSIRSFRDWCTKNNYLRRYVFSGGGFYGIIAAEGHPLKLRDAMLYIAQDSGIVIDPATVGDTGRMMRVLNSFNFGKDRGCFCIPLKEEELDLSFEEIHALASKPRFEEKYVYGKETFNIDRFKVDENKIIKKELKITVLKNPKAEEILLKYGWTLDELCPTIKYILGLDYVGHYLRYELLKYFKSVINMEMNDAVNLLVSVVGNEGIHSVTEGQAFYVFGNGRIFSPKKLKAMGICPLNCYKCMRLREIL